MNNLEFVEKLHLALESKTQYATGAFGAVVNLYNNRERYAKNSSAKTAEKVRKAEDGTFLFDCIGLAKGILWGWSADEEARYGGANYKNYDIPDFQIKKLEAVCDTWEDDDIEENMIPGEILRTKDKTHVGLYVGNGEVIECTQAGECKVRKIPLGLREWGGHGTLKYIDYIYDSINCDEIERNYIKIGSLFCPHCYRKIDLFVESGE